MRIYKCAACGARFDVSKYPAGKKIRCARCKEIFAVPGDDVPPPMPDAESDSDEVGVPESVVTSASAAAREARTASKPARAQAPDEPEQEESQDESQEETTSDEAAGESEAAAEPAPPAPRARAATRASRGATAVAGAAPRRSRLARGAAPDGEKKPTSKGLLVAEILGGLALVGGIGYAVYASKYAEPPKPKTIADATTIEEALATTDVQSTVSLLKLIDWCDAHGMKEKREEYLDKAVATDTGNNTVLRDKLKARAEEMIKAADPKDAAAHWKIVEWCDVRKLKAEADAHATFILDKVDANHEAANLRKGNVRMDDKWVDGKLAAELKKDAEEKARKAAELEKMGPRGKLIQQKLEYIDSRFGKGTYDYYDCREVGSPYLLALQKDKRALPDIVMPDFADIMTQLYKMYFGLYGELFELKEFDDAVLVIWIYATEQAYRDSGAPAKAAAHFEPMTGVFIVNNELQDKYGVMFHEGIHQLVDHSTRARGGSRTNKFWFTEGVATYFEIFERKGDKLILGRTRSTNNPYLSHCKDLVRRESATELGKFIDMDYGAAQADSATYSHYAQAWALTHFLNKFDDGKYQKQFEQYFKDEINGNGGPATFKKAFGDLGALEKEWQDFILTLR